MTATQSIVAAYTKEYTRVNHLHPDITVKRGWVLLGTFQTAFRPSTLRMMTDTLRQREPKPQHD